MNDLQQLFVERLSTGLKRKSIVKPSKWAEMYRMMGGTFPGKWTFNYHPWLRDMHDCDSETMVGQKAAQMGYTELALNLVFYKMDIERQDCLYLLPAKTPDASDFSSARFDSALEMSEHLRRMFSDVNNVGHKKAGACNLYIRGSQSRSGLKSIPVGFMVLDEVDEMNQNNISLALERASGQLQKQYFLLSTPTFENIGINRWFNISTQDHYYFKCPHCSRLIELAYPDSIEICGDSITDPRLKDSFLKCNECQHRLDHEAKQEMFKTARWVSTHSDREYRGFHISQLYSLVMPPWKIAELYFKGLSNPADEQEFYNSKLGLTHTPEGARVSDKEIEEALGTYKTLQKSPGGLITIGVDVGKWLHYEIDQWKVAKNPKTTNINLESKPRVIKQGKVKHFEELDELIHRFRPTHVVVDANPEKREAMKLANRFPGLISLCNYNRGITGKLIKRSTDDAEPTIAVDRTAWLDLSLGRFHNGTITLPNDTTLEYKEHLKVLIRHYKKSTDGNIVGTYIKDENDEDHFAHARNYAEIALPLAAAYGANKNIGKVV